ncbi:hypothetical protein K449DRAFT_387335 [Hypoxylon sp. EC38]|nr:hypothetical protein K449DRAFT_387335 [Hypoxylon sp. EC38]
MYPYQPLYPSNNPYLSPPQLPSVLSHHFGPYGTGPVSLEGMHFLNAVYPGLTSNPRPAIMPPPPKLLTYHPQHHDYRHGPQPWKYTRKCGCSCHYRPGYYRSYYGYGYNYGPGHCPSQIARY